MSISREIITIQVGKFANFVGTHWWNLQESSFCYEPGKLSDINHDVLFREGLNLRGEVTYTPRLVLLDSKENASSIRRESALYRNPPQKQIETLWDNCSELIELESVARNPYLEEPQLGKETELIDIKKVDGDESPTTWSQFLRTNLHPKSSILYTPSDDQKLHGYSNEIWPQIQEEAEDALRWMAEDCDYLQGFQVLSEGSWVVHLLQHLKDEYKGAIGFPLMQEIDSCSVLLTVSAFNNFTSLFSPLSVVEQPHSSPFLQHYQPENVFHSSAVLAAALETLTTPFRMRHEALSLGSAIETMAIYNRKMVCSSMSWLSSDSYLNLAKEHPSLHFMPFTPHFDPKGAQILTQIASLRLHNPGTHSLTEEFGQFINNYLPCSRTTSHVVSESITVAPPFPVIFQESLHNKLGAAGALSSSDCGRIFLAEMCACVEDRRCVPAHLHKDEWAEVLEDVRTLQDAYDPYSWI